MKWIMQLLWKQKLQITKYVHVPVTGNYADALDILNSSVSKKPQALCLANGDGSHVNALNPSNKSR